MPTSLTEASRNAQTDLDVMVIDEFRKESVILDALPFDDAVNPAGGGATLTYGYRRQVTEGTADTRELNTEYDPSEVTTELYTTTLAVMGGSFEVDRVLSRVGPAASSAVSLNLRNKIKSTRTKFQDLVINGDTGVDAHGFDGLDKALTGSDTEVTDSARSDWVDLDTDASVKHKALDALDDFLGVLDGTPTLVLGNKLALAKVRAIVRRSSMYVRAPIEGLVGENGRPIFRESYGDVVFADPGNKAGSNQPIIPVYDSDNSVWTITNGAGADGGSFKLTITNLDTGVSDETAAIAWNANIATAELAVEACESVGAGNGTVSGSAGAWTITFSGDLAGVDMEVTVSDQSVLDDVVPVVVTAAETADLGGLTDLYAVRVGMDGFHGVSTVGAPLVQVWLPDFTQPGAVKKGEVELGPASVALKATKAAAVFRGIRVR
jgi:hypothetical protein